jgi:tryptophan-rich sensory protein
MVASAVFTMVYTVLALFVAIRGRSVWSGGSGAWFKALEMLSYLQCFNSVFMFVCIMHVTGALQFAMRSRARPQYNYPQ